jgi:hypothetical protein
MRTFECADCQHAWQLMFGTGGRGRDLSCPQCGSRNVHRAEQDRGWGGGWRHGQTNQTAEPSRPGQWRGGWTQHEV